jgi:hypothetical protein
MPRLRLLSLLLVCLTIVTGALLVGTAAVGGFAEARPSLDEFLRTREENGGQRLLLDVAAQRFAPPRPGQPAVYLVAAVHIGEQAYYDKLQAFLDQRDLVLFEGVAPYGASDWRPRNQLDRVELTNMRLRSLAASLYGYWKEHGEAPATLDVLADSGSADEAHLLSRLRVDAWGNDIVYQPPRNGDKGLIVSLGADGEPGGEGFDADLRFADMKPLSDLERGDAKGIQSKLAKALGLEFQLEAMDYDRQHFERSDMSMDELERALSKRGVVSDDLFGMLEGSSPLMRIADLALGLLRISNTMQETVRAVLIKVVSVSDEVMESAEAQQLGMMDVLIEGRNDKVMETLRQAVRRDNVETIAVFYGAGHLPDLAHRLRRDLGYEPGRTEWFTAFSADLSSTGMTAEQLDGLMEQVLEQVRAQR